MNKHVVNDPSTLVLDSLKGLVKSDQFLRLDPESKVVYLKNQNPGLVSIISGGGAGHEPSHSGWVSPGLLTGAVTGNVFASPNTNQIKRGIELVNKDAGTLIVIMNYTGDILHFGLAKEYTMANNARGPVRFLIVSDDVAVPRSQNQIVGRRGLAGTVLVYKVAGTYANRGSNIDQVESIAKLINGRIGTIGVGLGHCHVPGTGIPEQGLAEDEVEVGMGIHNEPGFVRMKPLPSLSEMVSKMLNLIIDTSDKDRAFLEFKGDDQDKVALMVNNLGGISDLELGSIANEAENYLASKKITVEKILCGTFMTSLNMPGFSLTLLLLPREDEKTELSAKEILEALDEKTPGSKWPGGFERAASSGPTGVAGGAEMTPSGAPSADSAGKPSRKLAVPNPALFLKALEMACNKVIEAEAEITRFDVIAGDGDCGLTLKAGAEAILASIKKGEMDGKDAIKTVLLLAEHVEEAMGGTSGALYSIFFNGLGSALTTASSTASSITPQILATSLPFALSALYIYTRARPPSRTLVNPLDAFITSFAKSQGTDLKVAIEEAKKAAGDTRKLKGTAGRAAYVNEAELEQADVPDPGAWGVKVMLEGLMEVLG